MYYDCDRSCESIAIIIGWNAAIADWTSSLINWSCIHCSIIASCDIAQFLAICIKSKLRWWIGFCSAGDVEDLTHIDNVANDTRGKRGIFWTKTCSKETFV